MPLAGAPGPLGPAIPSGPLGRLVAVIELRWDGGGGGGGGGLNIFMFDQERWAAVSCR